MNAKRLDWVADFGMKLTLSCNDWRTIPNISRWCSKTCGAARVRRFPYALFFVIRPDMLFVIACFHSSRNPALWQRRT